MKVLIIYDSTFGNTAHIAQTIANTLSTTRAEVQALSIGEAQKKDLSDLELLIVGSPTQAGRPTQGIQNFLKNFPRASLSGKKATSFDTRVNRTGAKIIGFAAKRIARSLRAKGCSLIAKPEGFFVGGKEGPLIDGVIERAAKWARSLEK